MTYGLRIRAANGNTILDTNFRMGRVLGQITIDSNVTTSGSISVPGFAQGTPFYVAEQLNEVNKGYFFITVSGTTLSWELRGLSPRVCYVTYGVY